jgi:hypothetical protein
MFLLILFLDLVYSSTKKKKKEEARLTFTNPNYNGSGCHADDPQRSTFFKKFKYDRAQVRFLKLIFNEN